jgi:hypothetical protein
MMSRTRWKMDYFVNLNGTIFLGNEDRVGQPLLSLEVSKNFRLIPEWREEKKFTKVLVLKLNLVTFT